MEINTLRPRQNWRHFADDILKCIFLNENVWIPIEISLKCVPRDPIDNIPALVPMNLAIREAIVPYYAIQLISDSRIYTFPHAPAIRLEINNIPINTLRPAQNGCHFADNIFRCIF